MKNMVTYKWIFSAYFNDMCWYFVLPFGWNRCHLKNFNFKLKYVMIHFLMEAKFLTINLICDLILLFIVIIQGKAKGSIPAFISKTMGLRKNLSSQMWQGIKSNRESIRRFNFQISDPSGKLEYYIWLPATFVKKVYSFRSTPDSTKANWPK